MARNWLPTCSLTLTGAGSRTVVGGGDEDLAIEFDIKATTIQSPNPATFRIRNPSPATIAAFKNKEFRTVEFTAGYQDHSGLVYRGDIMQSRAGRENAVEGYLDIFCADGGNAYQQARVTKTLSAGYTPADKLQVALDAFAPFGITLRTLNVDLETFRYPRGAPFAGMARDLVRQVSLSAGALWSIQDGRHLDVIDHRRQTAGPVVYKLNSETGMVGTGEQTEDGVRVRALLNPALAVNSLVQIDQASINEAERDNNAYTGSNSASPYNLNLDTAGSIAADGIYRVLTIRRTGATRGEDWFDDLTCISASTGSPNQRELNSGQSVTLGWL